MYWFLLSQCSCSTQGGDQEQDPCYWENGQNVLSSQVDTLFYCVDVSTSVFFKTAFGVSVCTCVWSELVSGVCAVRTYTLLSKWVQKVIFLQFDQGSVKFSDPFA